MATFYKYAERSAESQVNWAEIGKDMTDMLREEVALREQKKAALDENTRRYAEELSNAPQGQHEPGSTEALRFADQATKYMLQQEKLLKSGLLDPRDYMIARQNLTDGTKQAFGAMKAFQTNYAELMERAKTDKSSLLEIQNLEEIQGYGNFRQSGFFIDSPTGRVNVGLKEEQDIDGQKVMGLKKGSTRGMQYIQGGIFGRIDKFKYQESVDDIVGRLGVEIQQTLDPATMSKLGTMRSNEDIRLRKDIDPVTDKPLFDFYTSIRESAKASVANPLQIASLLVDTLGYKTTTDPAAAAKDPKLILKVTDPDTGRAEYKISDVAQKAGEDFLVQQIIGGITRKSTVDQGGQVQAQYAPEYVTKGKADNEAQEFAAGSWNKILYAETPQEAQAAADVLIGTPRAIEMGLTKMDFTSNPGSVLLKYDNPAMNRTIKMFDESGKPVNEGDWAALGVELHGVVDREKAIKAGGGKGKYGGLKKEDYAKIGTEREGTPPTPPKLNSIPVDFLEMESPQAAANFQASLPSGFIVTDLTPSEFNNENKIQIEAPNGEKLIIFTDLGKDDATLRATQINTWLKANNVAKPTEAAASGTAAAGTSGTSAQGGFNATQFKQQQTGG